MKSRSKRYEKCAELVEKSKVYTVEEAVELIKKMPKLKYDETLEVNGTLGIDPKQTDQLVRGSIVLPHGTGKSVKIIVFCEPEKENEAKVAGADYLGSQELIDKISNEGWTDFDCCISTPAMMRLVSRVGKILGPRGLMPSPKIGTVTDNIAFAVGEARRGKVDFRVDKQGCIHLGVGKLSFSKENLIANTKAFLEALAATRPSSVKGEFIKTLFLSSSMGPSVKVTV